MNTEYRYIPCKFQASLFFRLGFKQKQNSQGIWGFPRMARSTVIGTWVASLTFLIPRCCLEETKTNAYSSKAMKNHLISRENNNTPLWKRPGFPENNKTLLGRNQESNEPRLKGSTSLSAQVTVAPDHEVCRRRNFQNLS